MNPISEKINSSACIEHWGDQFIAAVNLDSSFNLTLTTVVNGEHLLLLSLASSDPSYLHSGSSKPKYKRRPAT